MYGQIVSRCLAVVALSATGAVAQEATEQGDVPEMPLSCSVSAGGPIIKIVVCEDKSLTPEDLSIAGRSACGQALPCGAWIWAEAGDAPEIAPDNHDGLTQAQITSSRGVWVAEQANLILIETKAN